MGTELLDKIQALGIDAPYQYDGDIPWDARSLKEDIVFRLDQKDREVAHLRRNVEEANRMSRICKRSDSLDRDRHPSKRRERSREYDSSYGPSPISETRSLKPLLPITTREGPGPWQGRNTTIRMHPPQGDRGGNNQPRPVERSMPNYPPAAPQRQPITSGVTPVVAPPAPNQLELPPVAQRKHHLLSDPSP
jgi:hypothetical protein